MFKELLKIAWPIIVLMIGGMFLVAGGVNDGHYKNIFDAISYNIKADNPYMYIGIIFTIGGMLATLVMIFGSQLMQLGKWFIGLFK